MIIKITKAYIRTYRDNGSKVAYVEWKDLHGKPGRTEGTYDPRDGLGYHMYALLDRAEREGIQVTEERW